MTELPVENEHIHEVISELDEIADNGGALLRKFQIVDEDGVFEYDKEKPHGTIGVMLERSGFLHDFLCSKELNESIDGLNTEDGFSGIHWNADYANGVVSEDGEQEFEWYHPLLVDGYLAWTLVKGGAYTWFDGTQAEAKALGRQFQREVIGNRYGSFNAWRVSAQWSEWFEGTDHWDETHILVDDDEMVIWLSMFTDTD